MAFSTELVLAAQTGPEVDYRTVATAARTITSSSYSALASVSLGEGEWLVAFEAQVNNSSLSRIWDIWINGNEARLEATSNGNISSDTVVRHVLTMTGPVTVNAQARYGRLYAGTLHLARIG